MPELSETFAEQVTEVADSEQAAPETAQEPAEPAEPTISGKLGTLLRREQAFTAKLRAEKEAIRTEREASSRERQEIEQLRARYARIKEDPIEGLKEAGVDYSELTKRIINRDNPTAEYQIEELRKELFSLKEQREQEQQSIQQTKAEQQIHSGKSAYEEFIFKNEDKYPTLTLYEPAEVREAAWDVATKYYQKTGVAPDPEQLAIFLESQAEQRYNALQERRAKRSAPPQSEGEPKEGESSTKATGAKGSRTLTSSKAAERSLPPLPADISKMSAEKQREVYAAYLARNLWRE